MISEHAEFVILAAVLVVAIIGLFIVLQDTTDKSFKFLGRSGQYEEDAAAFPDFSPLLGGRGRRFVEDAATLPEFNPLTKGKSRRWAADSA